jgi:hypothetical protein
MGNIAARQNLAASSAACAIVYAVCVARHYTGGERTVLDRLDRLVDETSSLNSKLILLIGPRG